MKQTNLSHQSEHPHSSSSQKFPELVFSCYIHWLIIRWEMRPWNLFKDTQILKDSWNLFQRVTGLSQGLLESCCSLQVFSSFMENPLHLLYVPWNLLQNPQPPKGTQLQTSSRTPGTLFVSLQHTHTLSELLPVSVLMLSQTEVM